MLFSCSTRSVCFVLLLCAGLFFSCGSSESLQERTTLGEDWSRHPDFAVSLSDAIIMGMRQIIDELYISELGFEGIDVTVRTNDVPLLQARITDFHLSESSSPGVFSKWKIYVVSNDLLDYINAVTFESDPIVSNGTESTASSRDSLIMEVYTPSCQKVRETGGLPTSVEMIFWRNVRKEDKLASLRMRRIADNQFRIVR